MQHGELKLKPYDDIDFGLLKVLHALLDTQGVTSAAQRLGISQPAVSRSLARLRKHFDDMLLIRKVGGMVLTPRAEAMRKPLAQWMAEGQALLQNTQDPDAPPKRTFRVASTDFGMISVIMPAVKRIADIAPDVRIMVSPLTEDAERKLNEGNLDLIVTGFPPDLATVHSEFLFREHWLCICRADHPGLAAGAMGYEAFLEARHIVISVRGEEADPLRTELPTGQNRHIIMWTSEFSVAPYLATSSDAVITLPAQAARLFAENHDLAVFPPPIELGTFDYSLTWHERSRRDAATLWLIDRFAEPFRSRA